MRVRLLLLCALLLSASAIPLESAFAQANDPAHQQFLFAYKLLQRADNALAAEAFDDYLGQFPDAAKRGDALYYRALLHRRAGQNQQAADLLKDVPPPQLVPAYAVDLLRGQVLHDLGRHAEAVEALNRIDLGSLEPQTAASMRYLRGLAQRGAGNLAAAAADLGAVAESDTPLRARAMIDLARVQILADRRDEALATLERAAASGDAAVAAEAARLAGDVAYNRADYDEAIRRYGTVLTEYPGSAHFGPAAVGTLWAHYSAGRYPQVIQVFDRYQASLPESDRITAFYLAGSAQQELGHHEQAAQYFHQVTQPGVPDSVREKALYKLAASHLALGRYEAMNDAVGRLREAFPRSGVLVDAAMLLASAEAQQGDVAQGAARLTKIIEAGPESPYYLSAVLRRARLYEENGRLDAAATDYRRFLEASEYAAAEPGPAGASRREPDATQAGAFLRLLDVYGRLDRHEEAAALANQWLEGMRLTPAAEQEALYRLALAQVGQEQARKALATFDRLAAAHPIHPFAAEAAYYRGLILLSLGRTNEAVPLLRQSAAQEELSESLRTNALRLVALRQREAGQAVEAAATLRQIEPIAGRDALTDDDLLFLSRHLLEQGEPRSALAYAMPLVEGRPNAAPAARAEAVYLAGRAHQALGQYEQAERLFQQVVALGQGFDLEARLALARVAADQGQRPQALAELAGLINAESSPIAAEALYTSARIQRQRAAQARRAGSTQQQVEANREARRLLKRLVLLYPFEQLEPMPQLSHLELAEIAADLGEPQESVHAELDELIQKYPDGPYAMYAKAVLAADRARLGDAVALLESLREQTLDPRLASRVEALLKVLESET